MSAEPSMSGSNQDQIAFWNGPTAETWAREQARLDRAFAPLTAALVAAAAVPTGASVLDVGCGAGDLSLLLARQVGRAGRVIGLDVSQPMLERARHRGRDLAAAEPDAAPITWREADAATAVVPGGHDVLVSRFGIMFFDEPEAAFRHLRTALKPAGRLVAMCWQEAARNPWNAVPVAAMAARFGPFAPVPPFAPGPFALGDRERTLSILSAAGFAEVSAEPVEATLLIGVGEPTRPALDDAVDYTLTIGPAARLVREGVVPRDAAEDLLREALAPYVDGDRCELPAACWILRARAG